MDQNELQRANLRQWMRHVMQERSWSMDAWARKAGTTPTNITRFVSGNYDHLPSLKTILKLASVAGSSPNLFAAPDDHPFNTIQEIREIKVYKTADILQTLQSGKYGVDMLKSQFGPLTTLADAGNLPLNTWAMEVQSRSMDASGIMPGDMAFIDPSTLPETDDLVMVALDCHSKTSKICHVMTFKPPYLMPNSTGHMKVVNMDDGDVIGKVIRITRDIV